MKRGLVRLCDWSCLLGLAVFVSGGFLFQQEGASPLVIELSRYGAFALLAVLTRQFAPHLWRETSSAAVLQSCWRAAQRPAALWVAVAVLGGFHWAACLNRYLSYRAMMDLAIYGNACRNVLYSTIKGDVSLLSDHFEPLLVVFSPLCQYFDPAKVLVTASVCAWCVGAVGVRFLARSAHWSKASATFAACLYLQFVGLVTTVFYDFHLITLAAGLTPWLWFALQTGRWPLFWALGLLSLGLKESASLSLVGLGGYVLCSRKGRTRVHGLALMATGAASFIAIMSLVYPHFRPGSQHFYFVKYYSHLGSDLETFVTTVFTRPLYFLSTLLSSAKLLYLLSIFAPFLFMHFSRPATLLAVAPALFINVASNDPSLISGRFHYEAEIWPTLFSSAVILCKDLDHHAVLQRLRALALRALALRATSLHVVSLRAAWLALLLVAYSDKAPGFWSAFYRPEAKHLLFERRLAELLHERAHERDVIAANHKLAAHLTARPRLVLIDYQGQHDEWKQADLIVVGYPEEDLGWIKFSEFEQGFAKRISATFDLIYRDRFETSFRIWRRRQPSSRPVPAAEE